MAEHMQKKLHEISAYKKMNFNYKHNVMPGNYYVAGNTQTPGIIVEMGFISNQIDRKLLLDSDHQREIVEKITKGIISYFIELQSD